MDTLRASEMLQDAGLDPATAKAVVTVVHESVETAAATKLDLRNTEGRLNKKIDENFATLDKKIDAKFTILDKKIDTVHGELKDEIADVRVELAEINGKIDSGLAEVRTEIAALNGKVDANHVQLNGKIDSSLAEVRTEIATSVNRASRELMFFIAFIGAVAGLMANAEAIIAALL